MRHGDEISDYAVSSLGVVEELANEPTKNAKSLGLFDDTGRCHAICHANVTSLPGYEKPVLRIRHLLLAPDYDYGHLDASDYARALTSVFSNVIGLAFGEMKAMHIKFHLRSPGDVSFFGALTDALSKIPTFRAVHMRGAWLYLDLSEDSHFGAGATQ
ncbi:hypothetical protein [uncultured Paracoccus sp.]|uniref:hypothetical protein n=1 Tax=uncultured Paracoccus sp. TaxID=189685 RepID=UPI0025D0723B|nr:hypothetical protein [uncultured Paracoccus sp.]